MSRGSSRLPPAGRSRGRPEKCLVLGAGVLTAVACSGRGDDTQSVRRKGQRQHLQDREVDWARVQDAAASRSRSRAIRCARSSSAGSTKSCRSRSSRHGALVQGVRAHSRLAWTSAASCSICSPSRSPATTTRKAKTLYVVEGGDEAVTGITHLARAGARAAGPALQPRFADARPR